MVTELELLELCDQGADLTPPARALLLARAAGGAGATPESLSLGARDRLILRLRSQLFGDTVEARDTCPHCQQGAAFELSGAGLLEAADPAPARVEIQYGRYRVTSRPPTAGDLLAAAEAGPAGARAQLLTAVVLTAHLGDDVVAPDALPPEVVDALGRRLAEADPFAEVALSLTCESCGGTWEAVLDIAEFVWRELRDWGRRRLWEVHTLARAYGWRERDVLAMAPRRRQVYLEWVAND